MICLPNGEKTLRITV